jgi:hypothetical protein
MREKTIETDGQNLLLDALKLIGINRRDRVSNYQAQSNLDINNLKYMMMTVIIII